MRSSECLYATQLRHSWTVNFGAAATTPAQSSPAVETWVCGHFWSAKAAPQCSFAAVLHGEACSCVCRGGWKGRPVVALGKREGLPMGLHPLISFVARPVKHTRLAIALLKAMALMRSKAQHVPLHPGTRVSAAASAASEAFNVQGRGMAGQQRRLGHVHLSGIGLLSSRPRGLPHVAGIILSQPNASCTQ